MIEGVGPDVPTTTNEQGGMQSATPYAFHLIPHDSLFAVAEVFAIGAKRYARDNWRKIPAEEHWNHLAQHALAYLAGDRSDDHLGHMLCRAHMLYSTAKAEEKAEVPAAAPETAVPEGHFRCRECRHIIPNIEECSENGEGRLCLGCYKILSALARYAK